MPTALIIGASRGIGREFAEQLQQQRWKVYATARDDAALADLRNAGIEALKIDVVKPESLAGIAWQLEDIKLNLAVYMAGVYGPSSGASEPPTDVDFDKVMHTNVLGAMQAIPLVAPMVEAAKGQFVFVTSGMGSIGEASASGNWIYRVSKAALNMAVKSASFEYPKATFIAMNPGWVQTDMGGPHAPITVDESVTGMRRVLSGLDNRHSGSFYNYDGSQLPW